MVAGTSDCTNTLSRSAATLAEESKGKGTTLPLESWICLIRICIYIYIYLYNVSYEHFDNFALSFVAETSHITDYMCCNALASLAKAHTVELLSSPAGHQASRRCFLSRTACFYFFQPQPTGIRRNMHTHGVRMRSPWIFLRIFASARPEEAVGLQKVGVTLPHGQHPLLVDRELCAFCVLLRGVLPAADPVDGFAKTSSHHLRNPEGFMIPR